MSGYCLRSPSMASTLTIFHVKNFKDGNMGQIYRLRYDCKISPTQYITQNHTTRLFYTKVELPSPYLTHGKTQLFFGPNYLVFVSKMC